MIHIKSALLTIDLDAIKYNFKHLQCYYGKKIIAVLKDDAYGMGLLEIASVLENEEGMMVALSDLKQIQKLRNNGFQKPIIYLNVFDEEDIKILLKYNVIAIVSSLSQLKLVENTPLEFHLKFNCGMNRIGLNKKDALIAIGKLNIHPERYHFTGIMAHFSDEDKTHQAYFKFESYLKDIKKKDLCIHCFSSSNITKFEDKTNYMRIGLKLYGIGERSSFLHSAITLTSKILQIQPIDKGEKVGYNSTFEVQEKGFLYLLPLGYGQGWGRFTKSFGYCNYKYMYQAGLISMDYSSYFSTQLFSLEDEVELIGLGVPLESIAILNQKDPHEILVNLKLPKKYNKTTLS